MHFALFALIVSSLAVCCTAVHDHEHAHHNLDDEYSFKSVLHSKGNDVYVLHWKFNAEDETIKFAVNVSTNGWVGFGLSPNGGMPGSDVVIGWVKDGRTYFHDRYATAKSLPPIDAEENWELISGEETSGWTILEFTRKWVTCDDKDRDIQADTARVIYSWNNNDPEDENSPLEHQERGAVSLNLLGGLQNRPSINPDDEDSFKIAASNVSIPSTDTTYWCVQHRLPDNIINQQKYVTRYTTDVTANAREFVHHMLIYLCPPLTPAAEQNQPSTLEGLCEEANTPINMATEFCRAGVLIAAWAIGGADFYYPEDVAYPIGGAGNSKFLLLEIHYDNPDLNEGVFDSSGIDFHYTSAPRKHNAAISTVGHNIKPFMLIPPNAEEYVITGICSAECTTKFFPKEGIKIFANFLHTHLIGTRVELQHLRPSDNCDGYEELKPIENNPFYDFDYQQTNFLTEEITVLPGDILVLKCVYTSADKRSGVTVGGLATTEEMCLAFPAYYPAVPLGTCGSQLFEWNMVFGEFADNHVDNTNQQMLIKSLNDESNAGAFSDAFDPVSWGQEKVDALQSLISNSHQAIFCINSSAPLNSSIVSVSPPVNVPERCQYKIPDKCTSGSGETGCFSLTAIILCYFVFNLLTFMTYYN